MNMKKRFRTQLVAVLVMFCSFLVFTQPAAAAVKVCEDAGVDSRAAQDIRSAVEAFEQLLKMKWLQS